MPKRELIVTTESWAYREPFTITGYTFTASDLVYVRLREDGAAGHGEAAGVYYLDETPGSMVAQLEGVRAAIEAGASREALQALLPPGGARNALDCALWDLEAKMSGRSIWALTGIEPGPTQTVLTIGIGSPEAMGAAATAIDSPRIKVKLSAERPVERVAAVRAARPDAEIVVDVNQGWTFEQLGSFAPALADLGVAMIEQPLPRGGDAELESFTSPVPLCADESCLSAAEFDVAAQRYRVVNIKLDKCGGLTEALEIARLAEARGIDAMVGNMMGTSLSTAAEFVVAQRCRFVDLDGATFLASDREPAMLIRHGVISPPEPALWG